MLKSQLLLETAAMLEKATDHNLDNFRVAFDALHGSLPKGNFGEDVHKRDDWWDEYNPFLSLCKAGGYTDAAMLLRKGIPWLAPIMDYSERTVRLVNGAGLAVNGDDHQSRAETMPLALAAAWLKAQAKQAAYKESEEKETEDV